MKNTSKLLFNEEPITINRLSAKILGLNESIIVQQIHYWLEINRKAKINFYDERTWTYNTYENWQKENFDFWSLATLKRNFKKLFDLGILIKGNYNKLKYDRTLWVTINYDKLDNMLSEYERNVEISTKCQNDTMENIKMTLSKVSECDYRKCQNDTNDTRDYTETITEISLTTETTQNVSVVDTNKELIESKTHLLLDSKNKLDKIKNWNKDRLLKAIDIFIEQEGQYFSLLEKIYKDDKNFVPKKTKKIKTRFHNINDHTQKYTAEELENLLKENQKRKFDKKRELEEKELKEKLNAESKIELNEDTIKKCVMNENYFNSLSENIKYNIKKYMIENNKFIPLHIELIK